MLTTASGTERQAARVDRVRRFNRFYTRLLGVLDESYLATPYSLAQGRVLYELGHRDRLTATEIGEVLGLDPGYLSRLLKGFEQKSLIERSGSAADGRQSHLRLTAAGSAAVADLDARARAAVATLLEPLTGMAQQRLVEAMRGIETALGAAAGPAAPIILRGHRIGDMGVIVSRQAVLYAGEYGWNREYEALAARIVADFIEAFDPEREHCFVAEQEGDIVGSVFLIRHPEREGVAKLRLLYVEPAMRGLGLGRKLVRECTTFARRAGYHAITLWTNSVLTAARRIYEDEGYELVKEEPHHSFGRDLVGQTWELSLAGAASSPPI